MKKVLILSLAFFTLASCSKDNIGNSKSPLPTIFKDNTFDNLHDIVIARSMVSNDPVSCKVSGEFVDESGLISNAILNVNGIPIPQNAQNAFFQYFRFSEPSFSQEYVAFDGTTVQVDVQVNSLQEANDIYSPADIVFSTDQNLDQIDRTKDITINWAGDALNPFTEISVAFISRGIDGEVTEATKDLHHTVVTSDNGTYTIPASAFSDWPNNLSVDLVLIRGNQVYLEDTRTLITTMVHNLHTGKIVDPQ